MACEGLKEIPNGFVIGNYVVHEVGYPEKNIIKGDKGVVVGVGTSRRHISVNFKHCGVVSVLAARLRLCSPCKTETKE